MHMTLYTAIRAGYILDHDHSARFYIFQLVYKLVTFVTLQYYESVTQFDWEMSIQKTDRKLEFLKQIVNRYVSVCICVYVHAYAY